MVAQIFVGILTVVGVIALIIPGIILYIMFSLSVSAIVIEDIGGIRGMSKSRILVRHRWLKTFVLLLIIVIISSVIGFALGFPASFLGSYGFALGAILSSPLAPILPVALTLHYYSMSAKEKPLTPNVQSPQPYTNVVCPYCGKITSADAKFCPNCGREIHPQNA